ncbi:MAG: hypothetical protein U0800_22000, partial [Isosphaeraceae bacterium]
MIRPVACLAGLAALALALTGQSSHAQAVIVDAPAYTYVAPTSYVVPTAAYVPTSAVYASPVVATSYVPTAYVDTVVPTAYVPTATYV